MAFGSDVRMCMWSDILTNELAMIILVVSVALSGLYL
jgi:hypothetical protein